MYKKVEQGSKINTETIRQEIDQDRLTEKKTEEEDEVNPYEKVVLNNVYKDEIKTAQMEFWSILSDNVKCIQHDKNLQVIWMLRPYIIDNTGSCIIA